MTATLAREIHGIAASAMAMDSERYYRDLHTGKHDAGQVPSAVVWALCRLATELGYSVREDASASGGLLGYSFGYPLPGTTEAAEVPPFTITLQPHMSAASRARVLMHELSHVLLGHVPRTYDTAVQSFMGRAAVMGATGRPDNDAEEAAVELAAGAVCAMAGIGTGRASPLAVANARRGLSPAVLEEAERAAGQLWAAVEPALRPQ